MRIVDLRSDTVTLPTEEMIEAIGRAKLGDDVFGEDPTVRKLEELAAEKMGKESALLVTSGTQANLSSLMALAKKGDEVILEAESHIYHYEVGGLSAVAGLVPRPLRGSRGCLDPQDVEDAIRPKDIHHPETTLVCLENTHNRAGGAVLRPSSIKAVHDVALSHGLRLYLDGARIFNAAVALGVDVKEIAKHADSLMFCLSKGLSAPIGSVVVGGSEFVEKARKIRKMLGGGMRQAGIIAAPGIVALEKMVERLREDHENAKLLAMGLERFEGIYLERPVETNIVIFSVRGFDPRQLVQKLAEKGVKALAIDKKRVRMVTHRGVERGDIEYSLEAFKEAWESLAK
ncbi:MAG: aminotransferase class I/II-fold pyridoxal phosphate-dependent enzyme [Candidatus Brockarchaeota archaeon]|nr:aminotransferase class I/II-fold pyridoxal phosphate-dependent enzyme [Candidatus Brockarchaeota archaeon]